MYGHAVNGASERPKKLSAPELKARKGVGSIAVVTAYDFTMARLLDRGGADVLLVGDSLGMVVQGHPTTLTVSLDEVCYHGRAVARAAERAHVVGDMPFMSYQVSSEKALESAGRMVKEGGFESVKLEGGEEVAEQIRRIVRAGVPVMGHVGLTPQAYHALGGFKLQGRGESAAAVVQAAVAVAEAGAYAVVLEAIPPDVAAEITRRLPVPTIGIGAGAACDGQVLVCYDMLGMSVGQAPRFAKRFAEVGRSIEQAMASYVDDVHAGRFPGEEHAFRPNGAPQEG